MLYIFFILSSKLFNVDIYRFCLILLLLLLNVITFAISWLKLQIFVRTTVVVHKSSSPLRLSAVMKGEKTNCLKPPLMQTWSAFNMFLILCVWSPRKSVLWLSSVTFSVKIHRYVPYGFRLVLHSVSFWDAENSKGQSWVSFS